MVAVPGGITSVERRAVIDATLAAGAKAAYIIKEPIVAAIGADIPIGSASGHMIVDIGGGTIEAAVISLGGIVSSASTRIGGNRLDLAVSEYIRRKYGIAIGEHTAEQVKIGIGSAMYMEDRLTLEITGRDMVTGMPRKVTVTSDDVTEAIQSELEGMVAAIKEVLQNTPPELSADVMEKGMVLSGGTSQLRHLADLFARMTGVPAHVADEPVLCVVKGTGVALENLESYKRSILASR
jgi:rod shape-determining protein MreB